MAKVFVVPPAEKFKVGGGISPDDCMCACSHLAKFLGNDINLSNNRVDWTVVPIPLREKLGDVNPLGYHSEKWNELWRRNDDAGSNLERRQNLINWLRKYFPECEVKNG